MDVEYFRNYCLSKPHVTESFPFDETTLVFKVVDKMFVLSSLKSWEESTPSVNLKCDPDYAIQLREIYAGIKPGWHMNKKHWNTISINNEDVDTELLLKCVDDSYALVVASLSKKKQKEKGFI